nr:hypothetical protein [Tanacetum cinerariifolium]
APQRFEARLRDENEKLLTMDISNLPIMVNGEIVGVFGIARDISDQKHFERQPYCIQGIDLHVSASVGITLSDGHLEQPMQLIQQADMAMYKAKQQGRNNFQWYTSDLNQRVCEHARLRNDLQKAIETRSLQLHYQPQIDARTGRVVGIEALLRWEHPEKGFIPPAVFVPVAEDSGQ